MATFDSDNEEFLGFSDGEIAAAIASNQQHFPVQDDSDLSLSEGSSESEDEEPNDANNGIVGDTGDQNVAGQNNRGGWRCGNYLDIHLSQFCGPDPGPTTAMEASAKALDFFHLFCTKQMILDIRDHKDITDRANLLKRDHPQLGVTFMDSKGSRERGTAGVVRPSGVSPPTCHEVGCEEEEVLCMVKAGVGLMVAFRGRAIIRIYHQETFNHLQDVNVASAVAKILDGKDLGDLTINPRRVSITFMLASKGLLWIGTDCGCTLTLPLPRLEGVPQIKGRPSVSYHAHLGPVRFIVPINCGPCQLNGPPTSPLSNQSQAGQSENELDEESVDEEVAAVETESGSVEKVQGITVEGATESDTNCEESVSDRSEDRAPVDESQDSGTGESVLDGAMQKGRIDYLSTSMLHLPQQGTISRTKWTSTPDLRHGSTINLNDSEEDVINLYNNLIQGAEYSQYDDELFTGGGKRRRRPYSEMLQDTRGMMGARTNRRASKYATLPILVEDSPVAYPEDQVFGPAEVDSREGSADRSFGAESGGDISPGVLQGEPPELVRHDSSSRPPSRTSSVHSTSNHHHHHPLGPTNSNSTITRMSPSQKSLSKSVMIITGGEGHINWAEKNAGDNKYDDICLLLWQCRV